MQTLRSLHISVIQTTHQAALAERTPLALLKANKPIHLIVTSGYNKTQLHDLTVD